MIEVEKEPWSLEDRDRFDRPLRSTRHRVERPEPEARVEGRFQPEDCAAPEGIHTGMEHTESAAVMLDPHQKGPGGRVMLDSTKEPEGIKREKGIGGVGLVQPVVAVSTAFAPPLGDKPNCPFSFVVGDHRRQK